MNKQKRKEKYFQLRKQYRDFTNFLGGHFPVSDIEGFLK